VTIGPGADSPSILNAVGGSLNLSPAGLVHHNSYNFSAGTDPYGGVIANAEVAVRLGKLSGSFTYALNTSPGPSASQNALYLNGGQTLTQVNGNYFSCPQYACLTFPYATFYTPGVPGSGSNP